jgi:hypothetical protein
MPIPGMAFMLGIICGVIGITICAGTKIARSGCSGSGAATDTDTRCTTGGFADPSSTAADEGAMLRACACAAAGRARRSSASDPHKSRL